MERRKGILKVTDQLYKSETYYTHIYKIFKDIRLTHIEFRHWENDIWYLYGVSKLFDELTEGECVPFYDIAFADSNYAIKRL